MFYDYECCSCGHITTKQMTISELKRSIPCEVCQGVATKVIEAPFLKGVSTQKQAINKEMVEKNDIAGKRCRESRKSMKLSTPC